MSRTSADLLAHPELFLDDLHLLGVDLLQHAVGVAEKFTESHRNLGAAPFSTLPLVRYGPSPLPPSKSMCLLAGRRKAGHPALGGLRQLRRQESHLGVHAVGNDGQFRHLPDRHASQRDVLIDQQTAGRRKFDGGDVGGAGTGSSAARRASGTPPRRPGLRAARSRTATPSCDAAL